MAGAKLLDLTISNPTEALANYPHASISRAYAGVSSFRYRPDPLGSVRARSAVTAFLAEMGTPVETSRLALTASTSEAYSMLFKLLCDPGDEVLIPQPSYPLFEYLASFESVRAVPYRLAYDGGWFIDFDHLRRQISPRLRAVVVVNPNNPTGSFLKHAEWTALEEIAARHDIPVISDEVFSMYEIGSNPARVKSLIPVDSVLTLSLSGLSKAAGMPQMKLAWIAVNGPEPLRRPALASLELILDTYLSVATPVQNALPALLEAGRNIRSEIRTRTCGNLANLQQCLNGSAANVLHVEGGWSAVVQVPSTASEEVWTARLLEECNVVVQPGYFFDMESEPFVIVSLLTEPSVFAEGVGRLASLVAKR
jgi:hypothetical protein